MATTKGLYIGKPEAEAEYSNVLGLQSFFEDYTGIFEAIKSGSFIITGRKGAGKSAFAGWILSQSEADKDVFAYLVKRNEFDIDSVINSFSRESLCFEILFEWMILIRLVQKIVEAGVARFTPEGKKLIKFWKKNSGYASIDQYTITQITKNDQVDFAPIQKFSWKRLLGFNYEKPPFYTMIPSLREHVKTVLNMSVFSGIKIYVMFDDLDVKFRLSNKSNSSMLLDLIRMARRYNTEYLYNTGAKVLVFLRDDIGTKLEGVEGDKTKIFSSYEHRINWYDHISARGDECNILLRRLINKRLAVAFESKKIPYDNTDPWQSFVKETNPEKSRFKFVLDHTFYLPRDIITIFSKVSEKNFKLPLKKDDIDYLLREFSKIKKGEMADELVAFLDEETSVNTIFDLLHEIYFKVNIKRAELLRLMVDRGIKSEVFDLLKDHNMIIPVDDRGNLYFSYREQIVSMNDLDFSYTLPKVLQLYFRRCTK